jgi:signal transduction histidine kinase
MMPRVPARPWASWPVRISLAWVATLQALFVLATVGAILASRPWATTYGGASISAAIADLGAGAGMLIASLVLRAAGRPGRVVVLSALTGLSWLAADWIGWQGSPALIRTLAMLAAGWVPALVLDLVDSYGRRHVAFGSPRRLVAAGYVATGIVLVAGVLFRDPRSALNCWANCTDDVLLLVALPSAGPAISMVEAAIGGAIGILVVGTGGHRLVRGSPVSRHVHLSVLAPAIAVGLTIVAQGAALVTNPRQGPEIPLFAALFFVRAMAIAALAAGLVVSVVDGRRRRLELTRLADELEEAASAQPVGGRLRRTLGDPTLEVAWWLPTIGRFVDDNGRPTPAPRRTPGREVATITRDGVIVAVMMLDQATAGAVDLERELGPAVRLGLDNERLRVEGLAQLEELRASRARIVASGDAERERLERNLHDGAQQRLLAVLHEITTAQASVDDRASIHSKLGGLLGEAAGLTRDLMAELRRVADGIHPSILVERGLQPALHAFADTARIPVEVATSAFPRPSRDLEEAAYGFVVGAVNQAVAHGASSVSVRLTHLEPSVSVVITVEGPAIGSSEHLDDRVGAARGRLLVDGNTLTAEFPCAS